MIPRTPIELSTGFPDGHEFRVPRGDEISEEGFGFFRDVWLIRGITVRDARDVIEAEAALVAVADAFSTTETEYEEIATALETGEPDELPASVLESEIYRAAEQFMPGDGALTLGGLDLGVAGAVHALAAVRCLTAASCRGHLGPQAWSDAPVIFVAANRHRATILQRLVGDTSCGFDNDPARDGLLVVQAESVVEIMSLAGAILEHRDEFVEHRGSRSRGAGPARVGQLSFEV